MGAFYRGEIHRNAASAWKKSPGERVWVTKVWITGSELQAGVDAAMYARIKRGEFRQAA